MISKERLQELIDQKATIWSYRWGEIQLCDKSEVFIIFDVSHKEIGYRLSGFIGKDKYQGGYIPPEELEEDVEKGKWQCEMYAIRPERFEPPVWEDFLEKKDYVSLSKSHKEVIIRSGAIMFANGATREYVVVENNFERFYTGDLTKDNYIKACTIARKLFLGEKL